MYVFGGFNTQGSTTNNLYEYDFTNESWTLLKILGEKPLSVSNAHMAVASKNLFIHGGSDSINQVTTSLYKINLFTFVSEKVSVNNPVQACKGSLVKLDENSLLLIGGTNKKTLKDGFIYNIEEKSWEREDFSDSLFEVHSHTCLYYQDEIFIFGGSTTNYSDSCKLYSASIPPKGLFSLLFKDSWSDITVYANGYPFKCHKAVISQSGYFAKNINDKDTSIEVKIDPYIFSKILKYTYGRPITVSGEELFQLVSISQDLEFKELEIHCVNQLTILEPLELINLLEKTEENIRKKRKVRFYSEDLIKNLCLESLQKIDKDKNEIYQRLGKLDQDLKMEILVTPKVEQDGAGLIPEDRSRALQLADHFSDLRDKKKYTDCSIITQTSAFFVHKFIFLNSPYFKKAFQSSSDLMLDENDKSVKTFIEYCYNPEMEMSTEQTNTFERFCKKYDVGVSADEGFNIKLLSWDAIPSNMQALNKYTVKQTGSNPRLGYSSYVFKAGSKEVHIQFKITYVSWVGVGVVEASKVKNLDFSWNYGGGATAHGTNLYSMNGYSWSTNPQTHSKCIFTSYSTGDIIDCKISPKKNTVYMKKLKDVTWYEFPVTFPVCLCVNLGGAGDVVEILQKKEK